MPGPKTLLRLVVTAALLLGYLHASRFLKSSAGAGGIGVDPGDVAEVVVQGLQEGDLTLQRGDDGAWRFAGRNGAAADPAMIGRLLCGLASACCRPASSALPAGAARASVTLRRRSGGAGTTIELGPRIVPLQRQLVRVGGKTLEIDMDVGACLGLWQRAAPWGADHLLHKTLVSLGNDQVVGLQVANPLAEYVFDLTSERFSVDDERGGTEQLRKWGVQGAYAANEPCSLILHRFAQEVSLLTVRRLARASDLALAKKLSYAVSFSTQGGQSFRYAVSGTINVAGEHLLQVIEPVQGDVYVISRRGFRRLVPAGGDIFRKVPTLRTGAKSAVAVTYERGGRRCVLRRQDGDEWRMVEPDVSYEIYTPPPAGPGMESESTATSYVLGLGQFRTHELFAVNTDLRRKIVKAALARPAVRVSMELPEGKRVEILLSRPVPGTDLAFVSVNGSIAVADSDAPRRLAPDVTMFFDPEQIKGKTIAW